jgi:hypothetical protein
MNGGVDPALFRVKKLYIVYDQAPGDANGSAADGDSGRKQEDGEKAVVLQKAIRALQAEIVQRQTGLVHAKDANDFTKCLELQKDIVRVKAELVGARKKAAENAHNRADGAPAREGADGSAAMGNGTDDAAGADGRTSIISTPSTNHECGPPPGEGVVVQKVWDLRMYDHFKFMELRAERTMWICQVYKKPRVRKKWKLRWCVCRQLHDGQLVLDIFHSESKARAAEHWERRGRIEVDVAYADPTDLLDSPTTASAVLVRVDGRPYVQRSVLRARARETRENTGGYEAQMILRMVRADDTVKFISTFLGGDGWTTAAKLEDSR